MADDVVLNKSAAVEHCVARVRAEHAGDDANLLSNQTRQDAIVLNILRACKTSIDLAMHVVRVRRLGIPQESREAFGLLERAGVLEPELAEQMRKMVGFRNIAIHDYQKLSIEVVRRIVNERLDDFVRFTEILLRS